MVLRIFLYLFLLESVDGIVSCPIIAYFGRIGKRAKKPPRQECPTETVFHDAGDNSHGKCVPYPVVTFYFFLRFLPVTSAAASAAPAGIRSAGSASPVFGVEETLVLPEDEPELLPLLLLRVVVVVWLLPAVVDAESLLSVPVPSVVTRVAVVVGVCSPFPAVVFLSVVVSSAVVVVVVVVVVPSVSEVVVSVPMYSSTMTIAFVSALYAVLTICHVPSSWTTGAPFSSTATVSSSRLPFSSSWK